MALIEKRSKSSLRGAGNNAIEDWFENTFDPNKNGIAEAFSSDGPIAKAFDPEKNGVAQAFREFGENTKEAFEKIGDDIQDAFSKEAIEKAFGPVSDYFGKIVSDPLEMITFLLTIAELVPGFKAATDAAVIASELAAGETPSADDMASFALSLADATGATKAASAVVAGKTTAVTPAFVLESYSNKLGRDLSADVGEAIVKAGKAGIKQQYKPTLKQKKAMAIMNFFNFLERGAFPPGETEYDRVRRVEAERAKGGIPWIKANGSLYRSPDDPRYGMEMDSEEHMANAAKWMTTIFGYKPEESINALTSKAILVNDNAYTQDLQCAEWTINNQYRCGRTRPDGTEYRVSPAPELWTKWFKPINIISYEPHNYGSLIDKYKIRDQVGIFAREQGIRPENVRVMNADDAFSLADLEKYRPDAAARGDKNYQAFLEEQIKRQQESARQAEEARKAREEAARLGAEKAAAENVRIQELVAKRKTEEDAGKKALTECFDKTKKVVPAKTQKATTLRIRNPLAKDNLDTIDATFKGVDVDVNNLPQTGNQLYDVWQIRTPQGNKYYVWMTATLWENSTTGETSYSPSNDFNRIRESSRQRWVEDRKNFASLETFIGNILRQTQDVEVAACSEERGKLSSSLQQQAFNEWRQSIQPVLDEQTQKATETYVDNLVNAAEQKNQQRIQREGDARALAEQQERERVSAAQAAETRRQDLMRLYATCRYNPDGRCETADFSGINEYEKEYALNDFAPVPSDDDLAAGIRFMLPTYEVSNEEAVQMGKQYFEREDLRAGLLQAIKDSKSPEAKDYIAGLKYLREQGYDEGSIMIMPRDDVITIGKNAQQLFGLGQRKKQKKMAKK